MTSCVALLRGINVGGRHAIPMSSLAECFSGNGYGGVRTHLNSGNVVFTDASGATAKLEVAIERMLEERFDIVVPTVVRSRDELASTIAAAPANHGAETLRSEVFFVKQPLTVDEVMVLMPQLRDGVDVVSPGPGAIYFSRVKAQATKTRITRLMGLPVFQQMTVRTWRTTTRLLSILDGD